MLILQKLEAFLPGSRPVVFYSPYKEQLHELCSYMRYSDRFINVQLTESWLREYQVASAKGGSHPLMNMSGSGGFLLSATTVLPSDETTPLTAFRKKRKTDNTIKE